jgi:tetratricopeptide (TPR) repeat protein
VPNETGKGGPGRPGGGFEFGNPRGNDRGGRGDRDGRGGGRGRDRGEGSGGAFKVVTELSVLEKAFSKGELSAQRHSLESILKSLRPLRLKSLEQLDFTARGRLLTTLLRVTRQPKPAAPEAPAGDAAPTEQAAEAAPSAEASEQAAEAAPTEAPPSEEAAPVEATSGEAAPVEASAEAPAAPKAAPVEDKAKTWSDVMFLIGRIWRSLNDSERAAKAFELSGRNADEVKEEELPPPSHETRGKPEGGERGRKDSPARGAKGERPERGHKGDRPDRGPRAERPARPERGARPERPTQKFADWKEEAKHLETTGRTRDAARLFERNKEFADAVRLFEAGGDLKSALRNALSEAERPQVERLLKVVKPQEAAPILEKAQAFEYLMALYIQAGEFHNVAGLYERARQFDQAALAWERAGKYSSARKAFERAKDTANAERMRTLEIEKLIERGDRLGAATVLISSGHKDQAMEVLNALPSSKAFRFLQQLKLNDEANALAKRELDTAEKENKPGTQARWLETVGDFAGAAAAWERAGRNDKAIPLHEQAKNWKRAAELAEALSLRDKAMELYKKAGDEAAVTRASSLPATPPSAPSAPPPSEDSSTEQESAQT